MVLTVTRRDPRSDYTMLSAAWRRETPSGREGEAPAPLRQVLEQRLHQGTAEGRVADSSWWEGESSAGVSLVLHRQQEAWIGRTREMIAHVGQEHCIPVTLAIVGPRIEDTPVGHEPPASGPRSQTQVSPVLDHAVGTGHEQARIRGADPAAGHRHAAVFAAHTWAVADLPGSPGLADGLRSAGMSCRVRLNRERQCHGHGLVWQISGPAGEVFPALQRLLELAEVKAACIDAHLGEILQRSRSDLLRAGLSPLSLSRHLAEYELEGWGGPLVHNPATALAGLDAEEIGAAFAALVSPVARVLGQGAFQGG